MLVLVVAAAAIDENSRLERHFANLHASFPFLTQHFASPGMKHAMKLCAQHLMLCRSFVMHVTLLRMQAPVFVQRVMAGAFTFLAATMEHGCFLTSCTWTWSGSCGALLCQQVSAVTDIQVHRSRAVLTPHHSTRACTCAYILNRTQT